MAGKKSFNPDQSTQAILDVFREKGFSGTSIADLEKATGLNRSSLYNAFGDKEKIFLHALEVHHQSVERDFLKALTHPQLSTALKNLFEAQLDRLSMQENPVGCLITNTCTEVGCHSADIDDRVDEVLSDIEGTILKRLQQAQAIGELSDTADLRALARFFTGVSRAIPLTFRGTKNLDYARDVAMTSLLVLDAHILNH